MIVFDGVVGPSSIFALAMVNSNIYMFASFFNYLEPCRVKNTLSPEWVHKFIVSNRGSRKYPASSDPATHKRRVAVATDTIHSIQVDYELGSPTKVAINIFDEVRKGNNLGMGSAVFDIAELLGARGNTQAKKLKKGGNLYATVRKSEGSGMLRLKVKAHALKNTEGMFSKSDPFYELSRKVSSDGGQTW